MAIKFLNHLDLNQNEIQNTALHNAETSDITSPVSGQIIFDNGASVDKLKYYDGSAWITVGAEYSHPTQSAITIDLDATGADVISTIDVSVNTLGHVTAATASTRTLTLSDLGYTGATDANNYTHPNHTGHVTSTGDGATVLTVSAITGQTALTSGLVSTDEFVISDDGVIKRMDVSVLETYMQNNLTFTTNTDVDVSVSNLITRLGQISENVTIGDAADVTVTIPGDLVVTGTTTTNNVETISTSNGVIFEGNVADGNELTLLAASLTQDQTVTLPDDTGTIALTSQIFYSRVSTIDVSNSTFITNKRATINHALNSSHIVVQMYDTVTGAVVHADVEHTSDGSTISKNHVRIEFAVVPSNDIKVIIIDVRDDALALNPSYS